MSTPTAVGVLTRVMAELFDANTFVSTPKGGQSLFGRPATGGQVYYSPDSNTVEIDIIDANDKELADMVDRGIQRKISNLPIELTGTFRNEAYSFPLIRKEGFIASSQLLNRLAGENPYQPFSKMERLLRRAAKLYINQAQKCINVCEYLSWQSIITGKMPALIGATAAAKLYDFQRNSNNTISVGTAWDVDGAQPLTDIDNGCDQVILNGDVSPEFMLIGGDAHAAYIRSADTQAIADNLRYDLVYVNKDFPVPPRLAFLIDNGFTPVGRMTTPKGRSLWVFTYDFSYKDADGNTQYYLPQDTAVIGRLSRFDLYYGPSEFKPIETRMAQPIYQALGFTSAMSYAPPLEDTSIFGIDVNAFDFDISEVKTGYEIETQLAPIYALTHANSIAVLSGLTTPSES